MNDYTGTGQKTDLTLSNIHCINPQCKIGLSPTKSEYEDPDFKCCVCFTPQHGLWYDCGHVHRTIIEALNCKKNKSFTPPTTPGARSAEGPATLLHRFPNPKDQIGITKLPLHLIPAPALARLSKVMELGANKYGAFNWRETEVNLTVYLAAALRHIYSVLDGEDIDIESGQHHVAHFMACAAIILDAIEVGKLIDDRHAPGNFAQLVTQLQEKLPLPIHTPAKDLT